MIFFLKIIKKYRNFMTYDIICWQLYYAKAGTLVREQQKQASDKYGEGSLEFTHFSGRETESKKSLDKFKLCYVNFIALYAAYCRNPDTGTFWEFVQSVLHKKLGWDLKSHWMPWSVSCGFCSLHYSSIIKFEDFDTERSQFLMEAGLSNIQPDGLHLNQLSDQNLVKPTLHYFKQLRKEDFSGLVSIYKHDILLGEYEDDVEDLRIALFE